MITAAIGGIGAIGGALGGRSAKKESRRMRKTMLQIANMQRQSGQENLAFQKESLATARSDVAPWRQAGTNALSRYQGMMEEGPGQFKESEGYNWRLGQANKAIERSAAARGNVLSGRTMGALQEQSQNMASGEYQNFLNQYYDRMQPFANLSSQGLGAATNQANMQMTGAAQMGQTMQNTSNQYGNALSNIAGQRYQSRSAPSPLMQGITQGLGAYSAASGAFGGKNNNRGSIENSIYA